VHITILTVGSQGDVQPYIARGARLLAAGYTVTLVTSTRFAGFVTAAGLRHASVRADFLQLAETPEGKAALAGGKVLRRSSSYCSAACGSGRQRRCLRPAHSRWRCSRHC
jgi:UDP:flavonoid glycosyltransferase YjiC (YdhE family)